MKRKVLVIGLDGATFDILLPWIKDNKLPNLSKLYSQGMKGNLSSGLPIISPTVWTSIATGANPGKHGIFGYQQCNRDGYKPFITTAENMRENWFWEYLSNKGKKSIIINIPGTYPSTPLNGTLISGEVAVDVSAYPEDIVSWLKEKGYKVEGEGYLVVSKDKFIRSTYETAEKRAEIGLELMKKESWDLFFIVFTETDRMQHALWEDMENRDKKYGDEILRFYQKIDEIIGKFVEQSTNDTTVVVLSDHGFGRLNKRFYIDNWLKQEGFLKIKGTKENLWNNFLISIGSFLRKIGLSDFVRNVLISLNMTSVVEKAPQIEIDIPESDAFTCSYYEGPIYINKNRLSGKDYEKFREDLINKIKDLKDPETGQLIAKSVYKKEQIFSGFELENAPDILIESAENYSIVGGFSYSSLFESNPKEKATHRMNGMIIISGDNVKKGDINASIFDVAPTISSILGVSLPLSDGKVLNFSKQAS
jgi:predicted AlkP superfamily phosphohydrolase/phosphomutase